MNTSYYFKKLLVLCMCVLMPLQWLWAQEFLPPEQAFNFSARLQNNQTIQVRFTIAPNYYMYRDEFAFEIVSPSGAVVQNGKVKLPAAQTKFDENFNKEVAIYHNGVMINVPVKKVSNEDGLFKLVVTSRGCADKGLCYPPRKTQAVLNITDSADISASTQAPPVKPSNINEHKPQIKTEVVPSEVVPTTSIAPTQETAQENAESFDNSAYARDVFKQNNIVIALCIVFGLGVLLSLTPCMLPMLPILSTILAGQKQMSRGRGFFLALAYVTGMAFVYALIGVLAAQFGVTLHRYLQTPLILGLLAFILFVLALSMFDVFQLQMPSKWQVWLQNKTQGRSGYIGALLFGAASALIASPCVTAPLMGVITYITQTGNVVLGGLALFVLAYGMGLPLLILGAGFGRLVPKSGKWMIWVKRAIGVLMVVAAFWIAQPLWCGAKSEVVFQSAHSSVELEQIIERTDKPVLLDFYADWCRSCIEMERKTFNDPKVRDAMKNMVLVRVDMSQYTAEHAALLQRFNLYGPPATLILEPKSGRERVRVIGFEPAEIFIQRLSP